MQTNKKKVAAYKVTTAPDATPDVPRGWAAYRVGPALDTVPTRRTTKRRGSNRKGTVAPMTTEQYQEYWVVYDQYRCSVHAIEDRQPIPAGAVPIESVYGIAVHTHRSFTRAYIARALDRWAS